MKNIVFFILFFGSINACAQIIFPQTPDTTSLGDSIKYELKSSCFYSYFTQSFDSGYAAIEHIPYDQIAVMSKKNKCGYFLIKYNDQIISKYDIRNDKIEGLGVFYYTGVINNRPYAQSLFKLNRLNGVTSFYNEDGVISEILLYKKGKYIKYVYHSKALDKTSLKRGSKRAKDPFQK